MADRTIVLAQNKRHAVRGVTVVNPQEFSAYQEDDDDLTYIVDMSSYLDGATISSVTRTPTGVVVSNTSNTTTRLTQRLKGFGYVDINVTSSSGEVEQFRITIQPRGNSSFFLSSTGSVPQNTAQMWDVVADVTAANIDSGISWIRTQGYYTVGDGGAGLYKRVFSTPSHSAYISSNSNTSLWELSVGDVVNIKSLGATGDGSTNDTAAFNAAESLSNVYVWVPEGTYSTTKTPASLASVYYGPGKILLSNYATHKTPPVYTYISTEPTTRITGRDPAQEFTGDYKSPLGFQQYVVGSATAGQPTTGYRLNPELSQIRAHCYTSAGYNHSTTGTDGRTSVAQLDIYHVMAGLGDAKNIVVGGYISNPSPSRNSKSVADPALTGLAGGLIAASNAVNMVCVEMQLEDFGYLSSATGVGINLVRTVDPGANSKSYSWVGYSCRATASTFPIEAGFHLSGNARIGIDFTAADFTADQGAIALAADQRIHFDAVNTSYINQPEGTAFGNTYISYASATSRWGLVVDGSTMIAASSTTLGFFGSTPTAKPTVTGSRGGNAALQSLLTALANYGLITDSTS